MNIYIDCEFNSYKGALISMALVSESGHEFYEVVECDEPINPWVAEHVMPILKKEPIPIKIFQWRLQNWLSIFNCAHLIADWPEDISYFCNALITGPGERLNTPPLTMEVDRTLNAPSALPHNALEDAKGNRLFDLKRKAKTLAEKSE